MKPIVLVAAVPLALTACNFGVPGGSASNTTTANAAAEVVPEFGNGERRHLCPRGRRQDRPGGRSHDRTGSRGDDRRRPLRRFPTPAHRCRQIPVRATPEQTTATDRRSARLRLLFQVAIE